MKRREALLALAALAAGGCAAQARPTIAIRRQLIPANVVRPLRLMPLRDREAVNRAFGGGLAEIALLSGDDLPSMVWQELCQPLPSSLPELAPFWQAAGRWQGERYLLPWQWGVTAIAYNRRLVETPITDWADLWRPELRGRLVLPNQPREVIGLVQKSLGRSYSDTDYRDRELRERLQALHQQVLFYSNDEYLQTLLIRDAAVAVGWTSDLWQARSVNRNIEIIVPQSGTALWWEGWALGAGADPALFTSLAELLYRPESLERCFNFSQVAKVAPVTRSEALLRRRPDLEPQVLERAELWQPLNQAEALALLDLWQAMGTTVG